MTELLKVILHSFWSFAGTVVLLSITGIFVCLIVETVADAIRRRP